MFGGAAQPPTFGRVCEALGPTYPGEAQGGHYPLQYPGVLFLFPLAAGSQQQQGAQQQQQRQGPQGAAAAGADLPVPLCTPAARIVVHHGSAASPAAAQAAALPPLPRGSTYFEGVEAVPGQGLLFGGGGQMLRFGDSPQASARGGGVAADGKGCLPASLLGTPASSTETSLLAAISPSLCCVLTLPRACPSCPAAGCCVRTGRAGQHAHPPRPPRLARAS